MIYGYCRVSTKDQKIERQEENIRKEFPSAWIFKEAFTGRKVYGRKEFDKLLKKVRPDDTIVFDEVSRMARNEKEGFALYKELFDKGISLVFLKERHIDTEVYRQAINRQIALVSDTGNGAMDKFMNTLVDALNELMLNLAEEQFKLAFCQAQKEVDFLRQRTTEGMHESGAGAKISKARTGKKYTTKKSEEAKAVIMKHNKRFGGSLSNEETWELAKISKKTFYTYVKELEMQGQSE